MEQSFMKQPQRKNKFHDERAASYPATTKGSRNYKRGNTFRITMLKNRLLGQILRAISVVIPQTLRNRIQYKVMSVTKGHQKSMAKEQGE